MKVTTEIIKMTDFADEDGLKPIRMDLNPQRCNY